MMKNLRNPLNLNRDSLEIPSLLGRDMAVDSAELDTDSRTMTISFSSETVNVRRWFGIEILGHKRGEIELEWLGGGTAPLCLDHNTWSVERGQIGTVQKAWVKGGKALAVIRFGKGKRAKEIMDRVKDGELSNVSVGYRVHEMTLVKKKDGDSPNIYRATKWEPKEISFVTVPFDSSVGVGRSEKESKISIPILGGSTMDPDEIEEQNRSENNNSGNNQPDPAPAPAPARARAAPDPHPAQQPAVNANQVRTDERTRIADIQAIGTEFGVPADQIENAIRQDHDVNQFREATLSHIRGSQPDPTSNRNAIGLSEREVQEYSFLRAVRAMLNTNDRRVQEAAAFEIECAEAAAEVRGGEGRGFLVPHDVLVHRPEVRSAAGQAMQRSMTVGTAAEAGNLVATNLMPSFIDLLYQRIMVYRMGATVLNNLTGNVDFKKFISGAQGFWVAEEGDVGESTPGTALISLTPNTVGGFVELTRRTLIQSSMDIEQWVRGNLAMAIALAITEKSLNGDGTSNTPTGIANTSGIGAVVHGTNGAATDWAKIVQFETEVAADDADIGSLGYMINARTRGKLKTTEKAANTGQFILPDRRSADGMGEMNGYRVGASNQCRSNLTKGTGTDLSEMFFGNWSDLMLGFWSGLDLLANPYSKDKSGTVRITAHQDVDVAVARAESFSYSNDLDNS